MKKRNGLLITTLTLLLAVLLFGCTHETELPADNPAPDTSTPLDSQNVDDGLGVENGDISDDNQDAIEGPQNTAVNEVVDNDRNGLYSFTFVLDEATYSLPCAYTDMTSNGWEIYNNSLFNLGGVVTEDSSLSGYSYALVTMEKGENKIYVDIVNLSGNEKQVKDCKIGGISVSRPDVESDTFFTIAEGINLSSTAEEIRNVFGAEDNNHQEKDYESLTYQKEAQVSVRFSTYTGEREGENEIKLTNYVAGEDDKTEVTLDKPSYLSEYVRPSDLGTDLLSGIVNIDGDLYRLPTPMDEFIKNGWEIDDKDRESTVGASRWGSSITLRKNDLRMDVDVWNYSEYETIVENCAVHRVFDSNTVKSLGIMLPGGITVGTSKNDVEKFLSTEFEFNEGLNDWEGENRETGITVYISIDRESGEVKSFHVEGRYWNY